MKSALQFFLLVLFSTSKDNKEKGAAREGCTAYYIATVFKLKNMEIENKCRKYDRYHRKKFYKDIN